MENKDQNKVATDVVWDLKDFYHGVDDPNIDTDLIDLGQILKDFKAKHKGRLISSLPQSLVDYGQINALTDKLTIYLYLLQSVDQEDERVRTKSAEIESFIAKNTSENTSFYEIEVANMDEEVIAKFMVEDSTIRTHASWLNYVRRMKKYYLSEEVEMAVGKRLQFTHPSWASFFEEYEADLVFVYNGESMSLSEMIALLTTELSQEKRREILHIMNQNLKGTFAKFSARALYNVAGYTRLEQIDRGYATPMSDRNTENELSDQSVETLHSAVMKIAPEYVKRFYYLKKKVLGLEKLYWADRVAKIDLGNTNEYSFDESVDLITKALTGFSADAGDHFISMMENKRIHSVPLPKKQNGAYCYGTILPDGKPVQVIFTNYHGTESDMSTIAHEEGHAYQFDESGKHNTPLTYLPGVAVAETGSIFFEMIIFDYLKNNLQKAGDTKSQFGLLLSAIDDVINTIVRQICFSNFERMVHGMSDDYTTWEEPKKLSVEDKCAKWMKSIKEVYGEDGEIFHYDDTDHLWTFIKHFHSPFYVYGYAVGQLFSHSLFAKKDEYGDRFVDMYTELLRKGNTESPAELLAPFGLDLESEEFWSAGLKNGLGKMIAEAEDLAKELGIE